MKNLLLIFFAQIRSQEWFPTKKEMNNYQFIRIEQFTFEHKEFVNTFIEKGIVIKLSKN